MLSRFAGFLSPAPVPPPPPLPPIPEFRKGWDPRHVGNHVFFSDSKNSNDVDFYFITEAGSQFARKKPDSTLTFLPLSEDLQSMPRQILLPNFFSYIQANGFHIINEFSKAYESEIGRDGSTQANTFIVLRVQATRTPLGSILDCLRFHNRDPVHVVLQSHFEGRITSGRFGMYGNQFDLVYEIANLKNLYSMAFDNTVITADALIANFNSLRNTDEDIIRMSAFPPLVGLQDSICFYDFLKIYYISSSSFQGVFRARQDGEIPTYIQYLKTRLQACETYQTYLAQFSPSMPLTDLASYRTRLDALSAFINTKQREVTNYYLKFINLETFDHDLDESVGVIDVLSEFIKRQLSLKWPAPIVLRPVTPNACMSKYLGEDAHYPKILGFQTPTGIRVGILDEADAQVEFTDGTESPFSPLASLRIPLNPTSDIERFVYLFNKLPLDRVEAYMLQSDEEIYATLPHDSLYNLQTLGLDLYKQRAHSILFSDDTAGIQYNPRIFTGPLYLLDESMDSGETGSFSTSQNGPLLAQKTGLYYELVFTIEKEAGPSLVKRAFFLSPAVYLFPNRQRIRDVAGLQSNLKNFLEGIESNELSDFFYSYNDPSIAPFRFGITELVGTDYAATIEGDKIYKTVVWPDLDERTQLSRFGFFIPPGTEFQINLNVDNRYLLTPDQMDAVQRFQNTRDLHELESAFHSGALDYTNGYQSMNFHVEFDLLPRLLRSRAFGDYLDRLLHEKIIRTSSRPNLYQTGKRLLFDHLQADGVQKKLNIRVYFSIPVFNVQINVFPNRPCFIRNGDTDAFWPAHIFAEAGSRGENTIVIKRNIYNSFLQLQTVEPVPNVAGHETFKLDDCTVIRETGYPDLFQVLQDRVPRLKETNSYSELYEILLNQMESKEPALRPAPRDLRDFYNYRFSNSQALDTYQKIPGKSSFLPDARTIELANWRAKGGSRHTRRARKHRRRATRR